MLQVAIITLAQGRKENVADLLVFTELSHYQQSGLPATVPTVGRRHPLTCVRAGADDSGKLELLQPGADWFDVSDPRPSCGVN